MHVTTTALSFGSFRSKAAYLARNAYNRLKAPNKKGTGTSRLCVFL